MSDTKEEYAASETVRLAEPIAPPTANGHAGPRMERHYAWVKVRGYESNGFEARVWTNYSQRTLVDLESRDEARTIAAIRALIVETRTVTPTQTYSTWFEEDGAPLPSIDSDDFFARVSSELLGLALHAARYDGPWVLRDSFLAMRTRDR